MFDKHGRVLEMPPITLPKMVLITLVILLGAFAASSLRIGTMSVKERSAVWMPARDRAGPARHLSDSRSLTRHAIDRSAEYNSTAGGFAVGGFYDRWDEEMDF